MLNQYSALAKTHCHSGPLLMQKVQSSDEGTWDKLDIVSCGSKKKTSNSMPIKELFTVQSLGIRFMELCFRLFLIGIPLISS